MMKFFFLILILSLPSISMAQILRPFGGIIVATTRCINGTMLTISKYFRPPSGAPPTLKTVETFMFQIGISRLIVGELRPGAYNLGLAFPGGVCIKIKRGKPIPIPTMNTIYFIGTSSFF